MSTIPGYTLEAYVMWDHDLIVDGDGTANPSLYLAEILGTNNRRIAISGEQFRPILELYEPYREQVEDRLSEYDEEEHSWRDYAGIAFDFIPHEVFEEAHKVRQQLKDKDVD